MSCVCYSFFAFPHPVGPWRSWERASMASRRSGVRIPPAPPIVFHVLLRLHPSKRNNGAVLRWSNGAFGGARSISAVELLQGDQESRPVEAATFRRVSDAGRSNEEGELHQTAEGPPFHRRLVERVPVKPGRSGVRIPPAPPNIIKSITSSSYLSSIHTVDGGVSIRREALEHARAVRADQISWLRPLLGCAKFRDACVLWSGFTGRP